MFDNREEKMKQYKNELLSFHSGNKYSVARDSTQIRQADYYEVLRLRKAMLEIKKISEKSKNFTTSRMFFK